MRDISGQSGLAVQGADAADGAMLAPGLAIGALCALGAVACADGELGSSSVATWELELAAPADIAEEDASWAEDGSGVATRIREASSAGAKPRPQTLSEVRGTE